MVYSPEALGSVIRVRRELREPKVSQEELGKAAGYGAGAGVSISRVESGQTRPSAAKLEGIARALGATLDELAAEAEALTREASSDSEEPRGAGIDARAGRSEGTQRTLKERLRSLQETINDRTTRVTEFGEAFNVAHDRARDEFFLRFVDDAIHIEGAPRPPEPQGLTEEDQADPVAQAEYRAEFSSSVVANALGGVSGAAAGVAVGGAAAYATFTAAAMFGTASTGAAISGLSGVAATNATLALLGGGTLAVGGAGVAGGTMLLAGIVAAPAALLAVGGLVLMARRSKQKELELREKVDQAEAELAATQQGFDSLLGALARATEVLDYVGVHAGHAAKRWSSQLGEGPVAWTAMAPEQQERYQDFLTIAGCQLSVASINVGAFMSVQGADLEDLVTGTEQVLTHARETIEALV